jgi:hypothetical protein
MHLYTKMTNFILESIGPDVKEEVGELKIVPSEN